MNYFKSIALKSSLFLIAIVLYWFWAGLSFSDRLNGFSYYQEMESNIQESILLAAKIETQSLVTIEAASPGMDASGTIYSGELDQLMISLLTRLKLCVDDPFVQENLSLKRNSKLLKENCLEISRIHNEYLVLLSKKDGLKSQLFQKLESNESSELTKGFRQYLLSYNPEIIDDILDEIALEVRTPDIRSNVSGIVDSSDPIFLMKELSALDYKIGYRNKTAMTGELIHLSQLISSQLGTFLNDYKNFYEGSNKNYFNKFYLLLFLIGLLFLTTLFLFNQSILANISTIKSTLQNLNRGKLQQNLNLPRDVEFSELMSLINSITLGLIGKKKFAKSISEGGNVSGQHEFSKEDELGNELDKMSQKFEMARIEDEVHKEENRIRSWHSEGLAQFGEIFRSERDDVKELAFKVIKMLVEYLKANQGILFIVNNEEDEKPYLEAMAAFAFDRRKYPETKVHFGEGLVGTCAVEKESIYINEVPEDYVQISSGLGGAPPRAILIVPLKIENEIFGILEIASFSEFKDYTIRFTEQLAESIATTLAGVRINQKTTRRLIWKNILL